MLFWSRRHSEKRPFSVALRWLRTKNPGILTRMVAPLSALPPPPMVTSLLELRIKISDL